MHVHMIHLLNLQVMEAAKGAKTWDHNDVDTTWSWKRPWTCEEDAELSASTYMLTLT